MVDVDLLGAVADVVSDIPPGRVLSYGDVGALVGAGPRQIGKIMSSGVLDVPWWRVIRSDGTLPEALWARASEHYAREGTPLRGSRVDMRCARWRPDGA